MITITEMEGR